MKKISKTSIILLLTTWLLYLIAGFTACKNIDEVDAAKHAIEKSGCTQSVKLFRFYENGKHKEFGYTVETKSGKKVNFWFDTNLMQISKVCSSPAGITVNQGDTSSQIYTIENLNEALKEKNIKITDLNDILCNCNELIELFQRNYENHSRPKNEDDSHANYLQIYTPFAIRSID